MRWNPQRGGGHWACRVKARERQKKYARAKRATSTAYVVTQRLGRLGRERKAVLDKLGQLHEEAINLGPQS